jgi:hypothetical protein
MNIYECIVLAHGGGKLDPKTATAIGCFQLVFGAFVFLRGAFPSYFKTKDQNGIFFGVFIALMGYLFLAAGRNLPGRELAGQLLSWWIALPLLLIAFVIIRATWKYIWHQQELTIDELQQIDSPDQSPEEKLGAVLQPGEKLLWWGVPATRRFISDIIAHIIFGLITFSFSSLFLVLLARDVIRNGIDWRVLQGLMIGGFAGLGFMAVGIYCFLYPWKLRVRLREVVYALTDRRAIVLTSSTSSWNPIPAMHRGNPRMVFDPDQIRNYQRKWRDFGRTDLIFHREWREARRGGHWHYFGFLGLDDLDEPERVIKENYLERSIDQNIERA